MFSKSVVQPAAASKPGEGSLHDPSLRQDLKSFGLIGAFDDFHLQLRKDFRHCLLELRPLIAPIGEQLFQEWEQPK